jgi:hypothetical protein
MQTANLIGCSATACTARTSSMLPDDLAISSAFLPEPGLTLAIIYGCNEKQKKYIIQRLETLELAYNHPTLLPGLLVQLESIRLIGMVEELLDKFALRAWVVDRELDLDMDKTQLSSFLKLCFESRDLRNQIQAVRKQLDKMVTETTKIGELMSQKRVEDSLATGEGKRLKSAGEQIILQLGEIANEFDDKINDCNMMIDNMSLTMQTASLACHRLPNSF